MVLPFQWQEIPTLHDDIKEEQAQKKKKENQQRRKKKNAMWRYYEREAYKSMESCSKPHCRRVI